MEGLQGAEHMELSSNPLFEEKKLSAFTEYHVVRLLNKLGAENYDETVEELVDLLLAEGVDLSAFANTLLTKALSGGQTLFLYYSTIPYVLRDRDNEQGITLQHLVLEATRARVKSLVGSECSAIAVQQEGAFSNRPLTFDQLDRLGRWFGHMTLEKQLPLFHDTATTIQVLVQGYQSGQLSQVVRCLRAALQQSISSTELSAGGLFELYSLLAELYAMDGLSSGLQLDIELCFQVWKMRCVDHVWTACDHTAAGHVTHVAPSSKLSSLDRPPSADFTHSCQRVNSRQLLADAYQERFDSQDCDALLQSLCEDDHHIVMAPGDEEELSCMAPPTEEESLPDWAKDDADDIPAWADDEASSCTPATLRDGGDSGSCATPLAMIYETDKNNWDWMVKDTEWMAQQGKSAPPAERPSAKQPGLIKAAWLSRRKPSLTDALPCTNTPVKGPSSHALDDIEVVTRPVEQMDAADELHVQGKQRAIGRSGGRNHLKEHWSGLSGGLSRWVSKIRMPWQHSRQ